MDRDTAYELVCLGILMFLILHMLSVILTAAGKLAVAWWIILIPEFLGCFLYAAIFVWFVVNMILERRGSVNGKRSS